MNCTEGKWGGILTGRMDEKPDGFWFRWKAGTMKPVSIGQAMRISAAVCRLCIHLFPLESLGLTIRSVLDKGEQYRDTIYKPASARKPNRGDVFKTGLFTK